MLCEYCLNRTNRCSGIKKLIRDALTKKDTEINSKTMSVEFKVTLYLTNHESMVRKVAMLLLCYSIANLINGKELVVGSESCGHFLKLISSENTKTKSKGA